MGVVGIPLLALMVAGFPLMLPYVIISDIIDKFKELSGEVFGFITDML
jgi:hypothetical protein